MNLVCLTSPRSKIAKVMAAELVVAVLGGVGVDASVHGLKDDVAAPPVRPASAAASLERPASREGDELEGSNDEHVDAHYVSVASEYIGVGWFDIWLDFAGVEVLVDELNHSVSAEVKVLPRTVSASCRVLYGSIDVGGGGSGDREGWL
ncbi:unnamed protein product [Ilex paraguariensis]|uniref:Uncharacterized protein n=1 Tax=Ilex paraguariensis TaxID=185542 RepID=A0ABC8QUN1_9AQUA